MRTILSADQVYYIDHANGSDSNNGSQSSPFATISHAWTVAVTTLDLNGHRLTFQNVDETFGEVVILSGKMIGQIDRGQVIISGNTSTPDSCFNSLSTTNPCFACYDGAMCRIEGFKMSNPTGSPAALQVYATAFVEIGMLEFGDCGAAYMQAAAGYIVAASRNGVSGALTFSGSAQIGIISEVGFGNVDISSFGAFDHTFGTGVTFSGHPASAFVNVGEGSYFACYGTEGHWTGNFTGRKYYVSDQGVATPGNEIEAIPGSLEGVRTTTTLVKPQGRLSLSSTEPVTANDVLAATSVHYVPYLGKYGMFSINGAATYEMATIGAGLSLELDANSAHSGFHQANKNFDVFLFRRAGDSRFLIGTGPAWSTDTARSSGINRPNGVLSNASAITVRFGTAAGDTQNLVEGQGVWVGTIRTTAAGQTEDSERRRFVWNNYNRAKRSMQVNATASNWNYTTFQWRQANASTDNQLEFVRGLDEDVVRASVHASVTNSTAGADVGIAIGLDSTTVRDPDTVGGYGDVAVANLRQLLNCEWESLAGVGYHFLAWLEIAENVGAATWDGDAGAPQLLQNGIIGTVFA